MEYFLLIVEFHKIKRWKILKALGIALVLGICVFFFSDVEAYKLKADSYIDSIITVLGILIGFSISVFAILLSVENDSIREAKKKETEIKMYNKPIYLYESLIIELAYIIIVQGLLLIANFVYPLFIDVSTVKGKLFFSIDISLMTYSIILLLRNVLNFYFILTKKEE